MDLTPGSFVRRFLQTARGLRWRLTLSYVLFFTVLLSFLGVFFRQTLETIFYDRTKDLLTEEWGAVKGYLRIEKGQLNWYYDPQDPEESTIVGRMQQIFMIADAEGKVMDSSAKYDELLNPEPPDEIKRILKSQRASWRLTRTKEGEHVLVRSGLFVDEKRWFYVAIGRSLAEGDKVIDKFTRDYFLLLPLLIVSCSLLGWFVSGRALRPVNDLARTTKRITGSNLNTQIPRRGTDDELDRLIDNFNRMIQRLNDSFTQTRQFSTDVSHELRTPLTALRGNLEVALFSANTVEQYRDAVVDALQDVERLSATIRALLLLSQAESGQLALQKQVLDLANIIADIVDQFQIPAEGAHVTLSADIPKECIVFADRVQMERLVSNLLSNAIKYTPEGGSVSVKLEALPDNYVEFRIADTGLGIAPDHLPHIFDRFYRVPTMEKSPEKGLGLGLSFVAWIVKAHGGKIDVRSKLGEGTTFSVRLPAGVPPAPVASAAPAEHGIHEPRT